MPKHQEAEPQETEAEVHEAVHVCLQCAADRCSSRKHKGMLEKCVTFFASWPIPCCVQRIVDERPDRRSRGLRVANNLPMSQPQLQQCLAFLWEKYQFDGEGLPNRFDFAAKDQMKACLSIGGRPVEEPMPLPGLNPCSDDESDESGLAEHENADVQERAISSVALMATMSEQAASVVVQGPNVCPGPVRYIGVLRPVHLYHIFCAWLNKMEAGGRAPGHGGGAPGSGAAKVPSFSTFLRALQSARGWLRFRKSSGQHPNCDECVACKKKLAQRQTPEERQQTLERYTRHLLNQWLDRQVNRNLVTLAFNCSEAVRVGEKLVLLSKKMSCCVLRVDGVDQAKFRIPRVTRKTHGFDKLIRPALHVQGCWSHHMGFHLAVQDADMKKDTVSNIEVIARMLESMFLAYQALPETLVIIQDNTCDFCVC